MPRLNTGLIRSRCANSIRNTATGGYLGQCLDELDRLQAVEKALRAGGLVVNSCDGCGVLFILRPEEGLTRCAKCRK